MDRFKQLGKQLRKDRDDTAQNTRRIKANFPLVERKLDIIAGDSSYIMEFPTTHRSHSVLLNLRVKPDNCCECEPGAQAPVRDAIGYWDSPNFGPADGELHPAILVEPLQQTGTKFNYGYASPFFYPFYTEYPEIANYTIAPEGGIIVPTDGMYTILFRIQISILAGQGTFLRLAITQNGEVISAKTYTTEKKNLITGNSQAFFQYSTCVPLHAGDRVAGEAATLDGTGVVALGGHDGGSYSTDNSLRAVLLGLGFGTLIGFVKDNVTGLPIDGATVSYTIGFGGSTTTDINGAYIFEELTPGPYSVTVTVAGYVSMTRDVQVYFDEVAEIDFAIEPV